MILKILQKEAPRSILLNDFIIHENHGDKFQKSHGKNVFYPITGGGVPGRKRHYGPGIEVDETVTD